MDHPDGTSRTKWEARTIPEERRAALPGAGCADAGPRQRGRPQARPDADTRHLIAETALREFVTRGYAGAVMDDVARGAGVSKRTLYRLVPTKADLFRTVVADRMDRFLSAAAADALGAVPDVLERILTEIGLLAMSPEAMAIQNLVIAESERFPELAASFHACVIARVLDLLTGYLRAQVERGLLEINDFGLAASMLRGMMMEPQRAVAMGCAAPPTPAEIAARARACVALFLHGCRGSPGRAHPGPCG